MSRRADVRRERRRLDRENGLLYSNLTNPEETMAWLQLLRRYGMSTPRIAEQADLPRSTIENLVDDQQRKRRGVTKPPMVFKRTARKILAVQPEQPTEGGARMPVHGVQRRIGALLAEGYPLNFQAAQIGWTKANYQSLHVRRKYVMAATWFSVARTYDQYTGKNPGDYGISEQSQKFAKTVARKGNWAPGIHWDPDQLDNPAGFPDWTGKCGTVNGRTIHKRLGTEACGPCKKAHSDNTTALREARKTGTVIPKRTGGTQESKWDDPVLLTRLREDFEHWTDPVIMVERYGGSYTALKRAALRDDNWTHQAALKKEGY